MTDSALVSKRVSRSSIIQQSTHMAHTVMASIGTMLRLYGRRLHASYCARSGRVLIAHLRPDRGTALGCRRSISLVTEVPPAGAAFTGPSRQLSLGTVSSRASVWASLLDRAAICRTQSVVNRMRWQLQTKNQWCAWTCPRVVTS